MRPLEEKGLIAECYERSVELLKRNTLPAGVIACAPSEKAVGRHYASIFGRDAAICSMGMAISGDQELLRSARTSLITLAAHQAANGQIPKYVKPEKTEVDFWYSGCIDATLWWLIALRFLDRHCPEKGIEEQLSTEVKLAIHWLLCQEHQTLSLLQQNEASDWADIMPRSGFVLYSNALWYHVKELYDLPKARETKYYFNRIFFPFDKELPENRRARILAHYIRNKAKPEDHFLSFVNFSFWGKELDVFGNILALLLGLTSASQASRMVDRLIARKVNRPYPVRVVVNPIRRNSSLWRPYMLRHRQNMPYKYHNGGIWPFTGGFWVMLLARLAKQELAWCDLARMAQANRLGNWGFNEWLHGRSGQPMGMDGQSWNASMFILAFQSLSRGINLFPGAGR